MRKLLLLVVLAVAGIAGVGFQRGWFHLTSEVDGDNKQNVTLTVDKNKIHEDEGKAADKAQQAKDKVAGEVEKRRK
jgi:hypothetical protein